MWNPITSPRIGLLGGAFNPPHVGHHRLAELALKALDLDELRFVPTDQSPHKPTVGLGPSERRDLLRAALEEWGTPYVLETVELERGGTSYTVQTLETLHLREPDKSWILVLGSDLLEGWDTWKQPHRVLELASLAVSPRPGWDPKAPASLRSRQVESWSGEAGQLVWLPPSDLEAASSALRASLAEGCIPESLLPESVRFLIQKKGYYKKNILR